MNLSDHFTLSELTSSEYALRHGINNMPTDADVLENLHTLANGLERVRLLLGKPLIISSGYRAPKVNAGIGGSPTSAHCKGLAADFVAAGISPRAAALEIAEHAETLGIDQVIYEGTWVHVAWPDVDSSPRHMALTAIFGKPTRYVTGIA